MLLLTSCGISGLGIKTLDDVVQYQPVIIDTGCKWASLIMISKEDEFTPGTARQILNHNETYEKNCLSVEGDGNGES